jgi:hypothetical protein
MLSSPPHVCDARSARWRNRQGGVPENLVEYAAPEADALLRTGTRAFHRGPGRLQPHTEAEYIGADGDPIALITLVRRGRTIHYSSFRVPSISGGTSNPLCQQASHDAIVPYALAYRATALR